MENSNNRKSLLMPNSSAYVTVEYFLSQGCTLDMDKSSHGQIAVWMPQTNDATSRHGKFPEALINLEDDLFDIHAKEILGPRRPFSKLFIAFRALFISMGRSNELSEGACFCWNKTNAMIWVKKHLDKFYVIFECAHGDALKEFPWPTDLNIEVKRAKNVIVKVKVFNDFTTVVRALS